MMTKNEALIYIYKLKKQRDDLLAACKVMVSYIEANDWETEFADPMPHILEAISQAEK